MKAANLLRATALGITLAVQSFPAQAQQPEIGAQLDLFSAYVWRGLSLTNKPVAEPDLWISFSAGSASITGGGWANIDMGKYEDVEGDDISQSGGVSAFNLSEFDPYLEVIFPAGKATLTGGVVGYIYPNDEPGATEEGNTWEIYGKAALDAPLAPEVSVYYDVDKVKGAYFEGTISHSVPLNERLSLDLGATVGFNAGQDEDANSDDIPNFQDNGFTHVGFGASLPLTAGVFSISPALHLQIGIDEATKFASPNDPDQDLKLWGGVSISWSNAVEEESEDGAEE